MTQGSRAAKLLMTYKLGFDWWLNLHVADLVPVHGLEDGVLLSKHQREIGDGQTTMRHVLLTNLDLLSIAVGANAQIGLALEGQPKEILQHNRHSNHLKR